MVRTKQKLSSLHLLFAATRTSRPAQAAGLMLRHTVQFHWTNTVHACRHGAAVPSASWPDFDAFLASLAHDKRKKIRQERRKVADAGVTFAGRRAAKSARRTGTSSTAATSALTTNTAMRRT